MAQGAWWYLVFRAQLNASGAKAARGPVPPTPATAADAAKAAASAAARATAAATKAAAKRLVAHAGLERGMRTLLSLSGAALC